MTVDPAEVAAVVAALEAGGLVVLPTDTVYGIAALPTVAGAPQRLFAAKGRSADVPVAVLCADAPMAWALAAPNDLALALGSAHWPGPLTLVVPRRSDLDWDLGEPRTTIGLRVPDHPLVHAVTTAVGPIAVTSANRHGAPTPPTAAAAASSLLVTPDVVVDGGRLDGGSSTVVDACGDDPVVLRSGPVRI